MIAAATGVHDLHGCAPPTLEHGPKLVESSATFPPVCPIAHRTRHLFCTLDRPRGGRGARMREAAPHAGSVPVAATDEQQQQRESYDSRASPIDGSASDPFLSDSRLSSPNALSTRSTADLTVRQCTRNQAAFNIFLYMFGATQIPYAIGQMGWLWGTVFMVSMSVSSPR